MYEVNYKDNNRHGRGEMTYAGGRITLANGRMAGNMERGK
jgi:hypothetical protein